MDQLLSKYTAIQVAKAQQISALIFDIDGVLTDGKIIYTETGDEIKAFNVKDGQIIRFLKDNNILVGAITGRNSNLVSRRCEELKLDFYFQGVKDKLEKLEAVKEKFELKDDEIAYIGDDIIDLSVLNQVGLSVAPADALEYVRDKVDIVAEKKGGEGVVREIADLILAAKGQLMPIIQQ